MRAEMEFEERDLREKKGAEAKERQEVLLKSKRFTTRSAWMDIKAQGA
jgi:hypothetical protein